MWPLKSVLMHSSTTGQKLGLTTFKNKNQFLNEKHWILYIHFESHFLNWSHILSLSFNTIKIWLAYKELYLFTCMSLKILMSIFRKCWRFPDDTMTNEKMEYGCFDKIWGFTTVKVHFLSPGLWQFYQPVRLQVATSQLSTIWKAHNCLSFNSCEHIVVVMSYMCRVRNWGS